MRPRSSPGLSPTGSSPVVASSYLDNKIPTTNSGVDYIEECLSHGVPVPPAVDPATWINHGLINTEDGEVPKLPFEAPQWYAELMTWESTDPDGVCMALPRYDKYDGKARLFGIICLGRATGKTCFWDNEEGVYYQKGAVVPIENFVGGAALHDNGQGFCSDCHAGENPFIVHPDNKAFRSVKQLGINLNPTTWPSPIVPDHAAWPGNPGPITKLGPVTEGQQRCDFCHTQGIGRFPEVSPDLGGYCGILKRAAKSTGTMPPEGALSSNIAHYSEHRDWLIARCDGQPGEGRVVPVDVPTEVGPLSPPIVGPLYACTKVVQVSGARLGARLLLAIDGTLVDELTVRELSPVFTLQEALDPGQLVEVYQTFGPEVSEPGSAFVREHQEDYPEGLPPPLIVPDTVYECATAIGTLNIPGVDLHVQKVPKSGPIESYAFFDVPTFKTWAHDLGAPFVLTDRLHVRQSLCEDDVSDFSEAVVPSAAPNPTGQLAFDPPGLVAGQELINLEAVVQGAAIHVYEQGAGTLWSASSVPFTAVWWGVDVATPLGSPIDTSHSISAIQTLCDVSSVAATPQVEACDPDTLLAKIAVPMAGEEFVVVTQTVPGATLRVLADDGQIASGAGYVIGLIRPLEAGEVIVVTQELGDCVGNYGYSMLVQSG